MTHTKGPWKIDEDRGGDICIIAANEWEVCTVWEDPNQYDARLIAAAPDLLKALKEAEEKLQWFTDSYPTDLAVSTDEFFANITAAIAKATGAA